MSFLLDTDICSAHLKRPSGLMHRFTQHSGRLFLPTVALGELYAWAFHRVHSTASVASIEQQLLNDVVVLPYDEDCAKEFGGLRGTLLQRGVGTSRLDLMIASIALVHDLTLVTRNTRDYQNIPGLRLEDWLKP